MNRLYVCILVASLICCFPSISEALPCTFGSDPPDRDINWDEIDPVSPSAIQNDDFNFHFTIKTEWDWEDPGKATSFL